MVAESDSGQLIRSLVRVPGSGWNQQVAGSTISDLGRLSNAAASVPVSRILPRDLSNPVCLKRPLPKSLAENNGQQPSPPPPQPQPQPQLQPATKRARVVYMTPANVMSHAGRIVPVSTSIGPVLFLPLQPQTVNSPPLTLSQSAVHQLIEERNSLRRQNMMLSQYCLRFHQVMEAAKKRRLAKNNLCK